VSATDSKRLPAAERRQALVEAGLRVFSQGSYGSATTAQIAREAGVSEPVLYRHFPSKRDLYFACLDEAWTRLRVALELKLAEFGEGRGPLAIAHTGLGLRSLRVLPANLWMQAVTEAGSDPQIRRYLRRHMREVHDHFADILRRAQAAGGIPADRDPEAEAWIFIAGGLLITVGDRLGGLLGHEDFTRIATQRYRWLFGRDPETSPYEQLFPEGSES
jgi:AcrR family transcriptional regulator